MLRYSIEDNNVSYNISVNEKLALQYITTKVNFIKLFLIVKPLFSGRPHDPLRFLENEYTNSRPLSMSNLGAK